MGVFVNGSTKSEFLAGGGHDFFIGPFFLLEFEHAVKPHTLTILTAGAILASDSPQGGGGHFMAPHTARMYFNCTAQYTMAKWHI